MSLTRALMNGGTYGVTIDASKYTHDNGASRIAIESIEELHEIFIESFYNTEQAELAAATEGVALEGSRYEAVFEGAISDTMEKVKAFLKKLWEKVKAFFHQVKRYIDAMFMSGRDFAKKYKKDIIDADKTLKDFSFKMFEYADEKLDTMTNEIDVDGVRDKIIDEARENYDKYYTNMSSQGLTVQDAENAFNKSLEEYKKKIEEDTLAKEMGGEMGATCADDLDEAFFSYWRSGATDKNDKDEIDITSLRHYLDILTDSKALSQIDSAIKKNDRAYAKAIKTVDDMEKQFSKDASNIKDTDDQSKMDKLRLTMGSKFATVMSTGISREQSMFNKFLTSWKTALKERDTVYKQLLIAGMTNAKKNSKKK